MENFRVINQELFKHNIYKRFGFGKHDGRLITFVVHIECGENTLDRAVFTLIVTNGLKKCNAVLKTAKSIADKTVK